MYSRILLPLDGSPLAELALPHASVLAERFNAELILLKVQSPLARNLSLPTSAVETAEAATRELAIKYMNQVADSIQERGILVKVVILVGRPHEEIVRFAETEHMDIVVMCTRGQSGVSRWLMGSVADRVARCVNVPVLLVRPPRNIRGTIRSSGDEQVPSL